MIFSLSAQQRRHHSFNSHDDQLTTINEATMSARPQRNVKAPQRLNIGHNYWDDEKKGKKSEESGEETKPVKLEDDLSDDESELEELDSEAELSELDEDSSVEDREDDEDYNLEQGEEESEGSDEESEEDKGSDEESEEGSDEDEPAGSESDDDEIVDDDEESAPAAIHVVYAKPELKLAPKPAFSFKLAPKKQVVATTETVVVVSTVA